MLRYERSLDVENVSSHIADPGQDVQVLTLRVSAPAKFGDFLMGSCVQNQIGFFAGFCRWAEGGGRACSLARAAFLGRLSARSTELGEFSGASSTGPGTGRH